MHYRHGVRVWRIAVLVVLAARPAAAAQTATGGPTGATLALETGKQIYDAGCVSCHGRDGKGQSRTLTGFEPPASFPDFSDCPSSTPESNVQWRAVIANGGPARAFSS